MEYLTVILFERLGLLLVLAFLLTRIPVFRSLLDRELTVRTTLLYALIFGLFGIAGTTVGVVFEGGTVLSRNWVLTLEDHQTLVSSSLVAVVIAGLLGGPSVGLGAGVIAGGHLFVLGGVGWLANSFVNPLTGLLAGWTARFFSQERVISPMKALFIGVFPPILQMGLLLVFSPQPEETVALVDAIGVPLVLSNSVAIAVFTAMIGAALKEKEREAALETRRALTIAEEALPYLKSESPVEMAQGIAELLYKRLQVAAVSVTNHEEVLAHIGLGDDHHRQGDPLLTHLSRQAIRTGQVKVAHSRDEIQCQNPRCPLEAAIIIPIMQANEITGLIKFYFRKAQHIRPVELVLAQGLGQLISNQLNVVEAEKLKTLIRDAELRNLQAQINPHFLFNTLHIIATLFRTDPERARYITVRLGNYMRFNLQLASASLIHLEKECEHLKAYIEIVQARFAGRLTICFPSVKGMDKALIPPSTIQPLVENSIQHGLKNVLNGGKVDIEMKRINGKVRIAVRDNGCGFPPDLIDRAGRTPLISKRGGGTGLYNVNQRLIGLLGEAARLRVRNLPFGGSEVAFHIPYHYAVEREAIQ